MILSQKDKRWASKLLGFNTEPQYNIGNYGCLITSQAMFLETTPDLVNDKLKAVNGFVNGGFYVYGSLQKAYPQVLSEKVTQTPNPLTDTQLKEIKVALDSGKFVMVGIDAIPNTQAYDQHFVLLASYSSDNFEIHDPWTGTERPLSDYFGTYAKTIRTLVYQYMIYQLSKENAAESIVDASGAIVDALQAKLEAKDKELDEMRDSRNKWKAKYEGLDKESTKDLQAKIKHIEELQKTVAEQNVQLTQITVNYNTYAQDIQSLKDQLSDISEQLNLAKENLNAVTKERDDLQSKSVKTDAEIKRLKNKEYTKKEALAILIASFGWSRA